MFPNSYFERRANGWRRSGVADLLCHTSGYDDLAVATFVDAAAQKSPDLPPAAPGQHPSLNRRIRLAAGSSLARRPGSVMLYSNFAYNLLGDIVRRVSGQPFWQFVQRSRLFEPLGHARHLLRFPPALRERRVIARRECPPAARPRVAHRGHRLAGI